MALFFFNVTILYLFWAALSGIFNAFYLCAGLLSAIVIHWLDIRNSVKTDQKKLGFSVILKRVFISCGYGAWLLVRIVFAALHISKKILSKDMKLDSRFREHRTILNGDTPKTLFANSITLTPGTMTVDIEEGGKYIIHQLDDDSAGDIVSYKMEKQIQKIFEVKQ